MTGHSFSSSALHSSPSSELPLSERFPLRQYSISNAYPSPKLPEPATSLHLGMNPIYESALADAHHDQEKNSSLDHATMSEDFSNDQMHSGIGRHSSSRMTEKGVTLSWKDVWVTVSSKDGGGKRALLQNVNGFAEPGRIVAIMGPSGSGKSTLLDTLAGRLSSSIKQTGEILVNGRKQSLSYGNSAYVTQDDVLMATLTVWEAVCYSAQLQLPSSMSAAEKRERAESTIRDMGLQGAMNTTIGGWRARGLSGGEKRRVTIAIHILTRPPLLFLDEPTSGLDSAAAFHIINRLRRLASGGRTVIASIHQPSSDVFELFSSLYLLSNGRTVYFGPTSEAQEFFSTNGFPCPALRNPSDHYLRTINKDFEKSHDIEEGAALKLKVEQVIDMLAKSYASSDVSRNVMNHVNEISNVKGDTLQAASYGANFFTQVRVLTIRSFKNMYRDLGYYWLRLAIYIALCICVGTIFYKVGNDFSAIQARGAMLMFVAAFLTFMAIGGFPAFVEDMKVFERERLNGHYGVASFVVANTISSAPFLFLISVLPGAIAYFLVDLHHGFDHFAYFVLTLYTCMLVVESLMMMVASIVPDFLLGIITGAGIQGVFMLTGGFFRLPNDIPKPFWTYPVAYMAFHTYANEGFYKNDFRGLTFENNVRGGPAISGDSVLRDTFQVKSFSKWVDLLILVGMAVVYRLLFFGLIKLKEKLRPIIKDLRSRSSASSSTLSQEDEKIV
ncbi:hypothetical protein L7F22_046552 [Adiantum nelumboides]|nr:hypothetical protein [Adiantum nelumboides]